MIAAIKSKFQSYCDVQRTLSLCTEQICALLRGRDNNGWTTVWLTEPAVPYMYRDQQWIAYDNVDSVTYKARAS